MNFLKLPVLSWREVARDKRRNVLPIIRELSPLPEIPPDFMGAVLHGEAVAELKGRLRKTKCCGLCGGYVAKGTIDHMIPRCRGGLHTATNLIITCSRCNMQKGSRTVEEYARDMLRAVRALRRRLKRHEMVTASPTTPS